VLLKAGLVLLGLFVGSALSPEEAVVLQGISKSGRCVSLGDTPDSRIARTPLISPGQPPLLSFRYYEGKSHHRFGNAELMLDDAGH
jgi:hypothetical protein